MLIKYNIKEATTVMAITEIVHTISKRKLNYLLCHVIPGQHIWTRHTFVLSVSVCVCVLCLLRRLNLIEDATVQQDTGLVVFSNLFFFLPLWSIEIDSSWISNPKQTTTDAVLSAIYDLAGLIPVWSCLL